MATFITNPCAPQDANFFTSGSYADASYSTLWTTKTVPDVEGLGTAVYLQVLKKFNIPVIEGYTGLPPGGLLPGIDIHSMDALQAIRLSLAESLTNGQWWEMYESSEGGVYFLNVFDNGSPGKTINLNIRMCVPSSSLDNAVDMVIVHGYNPPPERYTGEFRDVVPQGTGDINPTDVDGTEDLFTVSPASLVNTSHKGLLQNTVYKSYPDPIFTDKFGTQEKNPFYDVSAYENIIGYIHRITGMPDSPDEAARVSYNFSDTTPWFSEITNFPTFSKVDSPTGSTGLPTGGDIKYYEAVYDFEGKNFTDRYGTQWPLMGPPRALIYTGHLVESIVESGEYITVYAKPTKELKRLEEGSQWIFSVQGVNQYRVVLYYQPSMSIEEWDVALSLINASDGTEVEAKYYYSDGGILVQEKSYSTFSFESFKSIIPAPSAVGYSVTQAWLEIPLKRPCVVVKDVGGDALSYAQDLRVEYAPIIVKDPPAPTAYYHKDNGGTVVDHSQSLADSDPTTCQNFEETDEQIMRELQAGNSIEVSLPFCANGDECLDVAKTIFDYMSHTDTQTYVVTCAPDDDPVLGAHVDGFPSDLRIQSINYNYQDGSSYTVDVTLGPVFVSIGSWNNTAWVPKTENVERRAIVIWTAGDGTNYRVRVQGLGEYNAINGTNTVFTVGEIVSVTIYNNPVEQ